MLMQMMVATTQEKGSIQEGIDDIYSRPSNTESTRD